MAGICGKQNKNAIFLSRIILWAFFIQHTFLGTHTHTFIIPRMLVNKFSQPNRQLLIIFCQRMFVLVYHLRLKKKTYTIGNIFPKTNNSKAVRIIFHFKDTKMNGKIRTINLCELSYIYIEQRPLILQTITKRSIYTCLQ